MDNSLSESSSAGTCLRNRNSIKIVSLMVASSLLLVKNEHTFHKDNTGI